MRGMVLGDSFRIPEELEEAFRRSGITHITHRNKKRQSPEGIRLLVLC